MFVILHINKDLVGVIDSYVNYMQMSVKGQNFEMIKMTVEQLSAQ